MVTVLESDLENCKSTDADLVVSQQELKECTEDLDAQTRKNIQCESEKKTRDGELQNKIKQNQNLRYQNSKLLNSINTNMNIYTNTKLNQLW